MDIKLAAKWAGVTEQEFRALNPGHRTPVLAQKEGSKLLLPVDRVGSFERKLAQYSGKTPTTSWKIYRTDRRERIRDIASRHKMKLRDLLRVNNLSSRRKTLRAGQTLLVKPASVGKGGMPPTVAF